MHQELYLVRNMRGNKKGFNSCVTNKSEPRENVNPLLNGTQDRTEQAKVLCEVFPSVFASKASCP